MVDRYTAVKANGWRKVEPLDRYTAVKTNGWRKVEP
jgi:hypothetical protein